MVQSYKTRFDIVRVFSKHLQCRYNLKYGLKQLGYIQHELYDKLFMVKGWIDKV